MTEGQTEKITYEVALEEFDRFAAAWRLDTDLETMSEEDIEDFEAAKRKIALQIKAGNASVNDEGNIVYQLFQPVGILTEITLKRPSGRAYTDTDKARDGKNITKSNHLIASAIGQLPMILQKMDGIDYKYIQAVYGLFLGS